MIIRRNGGRRWRSQQATRRGDRQGIVGPDGVAVREGVARGERSADLGEPRDRSAVARRRIALGKGVGNLTEFLSELQRQNVRGVAMTLDTAGVVNAPGDLFAAVAAFEAVAQPAYAANFLEFSRTRPIRFDVVTPSRGETLTPAEIERRAEETRAKIDAAIPNKPYATPKKPRTLLVIESLEDVANHDSPSNVSSSGWRKTAPGRRASATNCEPRYKVKQ